MKSKVESSSPQQRASRARSPGSRDGQQETRVQIVPGQRQRQEAAQEVCGVTRYMILLSNIIQVVIISPRLLHHHQPHPKRQVQNNTHILLPL